MVLSPSWSPVVVALFAICKCTHMISSRSMVCTQQLIQNTAIDKKTDHVYKARRISKKGRRGSRMTLRMKTIYDFGETQVNKPTRKIVSYGNTNQPRPTIPIRRWCRHPDGSYRPIVECPSGQEAIELAVIGARHRAEWKRNKSTEGA